MKLKRISTTKAEKGKPAFVIEIDKKRVEFSHTEIEINSLDSNEKLKAAFVSAFGKDEQVFFHINRDSSLAVATGFPPEIWPEDEKE